ncbi:MAG: DUF1801 domain-containing protein [Acidimicrobiales bacterium]|nr:DUF1801 domain-containing protein [Acidimicrobiales bacterium]
MTDGRTPIDDHLARFEGTQLATLQALRSMLHDLLPTAEECVKYRMPCFAVEGKAVAMFDGFSQHCSYFPSSGGIVEQVRIPSWCSTSKGALRFPVDRVPPRALIKRLIRLRLDELSEVRNGRRYEFFDDGRVKAVGGMKDGALQGAWQWFRQDGSLMRTGRFRHGEQVGVWETWDRNGRLVRSTTY